MGAFAYCQHRGCECGLARPTLFEVQYNAWECREGHHNEIANPLDTVISIFEEKFEELEARVLALELT